MIALALALAAQANTSPAEPKAAVDSGNSTCATAWQPQHSLESYAWVMGFWSGVSSERGGRIGAELPASEIVNQVKKTCVTEQSALLADATSATYQRMSQR